MKHSSSCYEQTTIFQWRFFSPVTDANVKPSELKVQYLQTTTATLQWINPDCKLLRSEPKYAISIEGEDVWDKTKRQYSTPFSSVAISGLIPHSHYKARIYLENGSRDNQKNHLSLRFMTKGAGTEFILQFFKYIIICIKTKLH